MKLDESEILKQIIELLRKRLDLVENHLVELYERVKELENEDGN